MKTLLLLTLSVVLASPMNGQLVGKPGFIASITPKPVLGAGAQITFVSLGSSAKAANGNVTPGLPSGLQSGDILICAMHVSSQASIAPNDTGFWTQIAQGNGGGSSSRFAVFWGRYTGVTPDLQMNTASGNTVVAGIAAYRNCSPSGSPIDVVSSVGSGTDDSIEHAAFNVADGNIRIIVNGAADDNNRTSLGGSANIRFSDGGGINCYATTLGTPDGSLALNDEAISPGASIAQTTMTQAAADPWASVQFSMKP